MAGDEPVTAPDQHKPGHRKSGRIGALPSALVLVLMALCGIEEGRVEHIWLFGIAGLLVAIVIGDAVLRRNGLRS